MTAVLNGYTPTPHDDIAALLASLNPGDRCVDLGSGDGRIVRAAAALGAVATGWERDPELVRKSESLGGAIIECDFMAKDWSAFDVVVGNVDATMEPEVIAKFKREGLPGARLVLYGARVIVHG